MYDFNMMEKLLLAATIIFAISTITLSIILPLSISNNNNEDKQSPQLTILNSFVLPGRTELIDIMFHLGYETPPISTFVFSTSGETSPLRFGDTITSNKGITVEVTRGQLSAVSSDFTGYTSFTGCAAYQLQTILYRLFIQTRTDLFLSTFNMNEKVFSDSKSVLKGEFRENSLFAISPDQFFTSTSGIDGSFLLVGNITNDILTTQDLAPNVESTFKKSIIGFKNNIMFIDSDDDSIYHSVFTEDMWKTNILYPKPDGSTLDALGLYISPGKPNILISAINNNSTTRLQSFIQKSETIDDWILSSFIDLTTKYDFFGKIYMTENTAGTEISIAFMSSVNSLVLVRVNSNLSEKVQEKSFTLPASEEIIYRVMNIITYTNQAGNEEVQVMLQQGDTVVSIIFDSTLAIRDRGEMTSMMSAAGAAGFCVGTSVIPNGQMQAVVQVQDQINSNASYKVAIAIWAPSVSVSLVSQKTAIIMS
jgi:hypothetical protein